LYDFIHNTEDIILCNIGLQGRIQDFKLGGVYLKKLRRAEGGANFFWVFHVKNHDFMQKNHIFSNFRGGARRVHSLPGSTPGCVLHDFIQNT
jgi:hypothetical protein